MSAAPTLFRTVIRPAAEQDFLGLMSVKPDERLHRERLACQQDGGWLYLVAADAHGAGGHGAVYGFVVLIWGGDEYHVGYPIVADLLVRESFRGHGLGTRLLERAEWLCRERGHALIGLSVNPTDNPRAQSLYQRRGYRDTGQPPHCDLYADADQYGFPHLYQDWCICMTKELQS